jgi:calpain-15
MDKNENLLEDQIEHKELAPGVILYKEYKQKNEGNIVGIFIWKVEITTMSIVDFEVHLDQSENIELENQTNENELKTVNKVLPFETKEVARVVLKQGWKLKSKFKLTMNVPDKEMQYSYIEHDEMMIGEQEKVFRQYFENLPLEIMSKEEIEKELGTQKVNFIDLDFLPNDDAIVNPRYGENMKDIFDYVIHWRRPHEFCLGENINDEEIKEIQIFNYQDVEPNDIQQGILPDNHLASALSALAEKGNLIKRLFKSDKYSEYGVYQVKLCINGEWNTITIDDYFPCIPKSNPLVSRSPGNEIWVLILEKAIAKVYESYYSLIHVNIADFFLLLTGCPSFYLNLEDIIKNDGHDICMKRLKTYVSEKKYLVVALSKPSEADANNEEEDDNMLTIGNYGYTILDVKNKQTDNLVFLRKIWYDQKKEEKIRVYEDQLKQTFPSVELSEGQLILSKSNL